MAKLYMNHLPFIAGRSCDRNWVVTLGQGQRSKGTKLMSCFSFLTGFLVVMAEEIEGLAPHQLVNIYHRFVAQDTCLSKILSNFCTLCGSPPGGNDG